MILSALNDYYIRMVGDPDASMPKPGFSEEKISFAIMIDEAGTFKRVIDLREVSGKKVGPKRMIVPAAEKRSGTSVVPNFLWDNSGYVLCLDGKGKPERTQTTFESFRKKHQEVAAASKSPRIRAVASFLDAWSSEKAEQLDLKEELLDQNIVFWMEGDDVPLHENPEVISVWKGRQGSGEADGYSAPCLVTGEVQPIARLHPPIKGVVGGQPAGCAIVSFNLDAFLSYGKEQSFNAPVSKHVAFAYTTALNYLLRRENKRSLLIGDSSTVFWAEKKTPAEDLLSVMFDLSNEPEEENSEEGPGEDVQTARKVRSLLRALCDGRPSEAPMGDLDPDVRFFVLGLAPNQSRISVRFWCRSTFGELAQKISTHYAALRIERQYQNQPEFPALWQILLETAAQQKRENIPPMLSGALSRSVLTGSRYPESLYAAVIGRIRADKQVNYIRAAIIKACLIRNHPDKAGEMTMALNSDRKDVPYLLGRLFSLLEKVQSDALGKIGTSIRHRYFSSASATPSIVFPQLLRLAQHHIAKAEYGGNMDRKIQAVVEDIDDFPARLSLQDQGVFTIGYYHQANANYRKTEKE
ncbi:type I-C CRISPR-associated protein Cas8c/Csd1 [Desulfoluna sp.]|uniref:type I-C CRISPR-associated protein Cas8c/Csd1 n=1 Tax=Desulfoluna sp. TaxID=2045199 RepID=UPI00262DBFE9|nr:type I-C CRISPR-associated protein Cas8c/Csd1 [Desulfoluna sp.]